VCFVKTWAMKTVNFLGRKSNWLQLGVYNILKVRNALVKSVTSQNIECSIH
jgi:hypothetical protein